MTTIDLSQLPPPAIVEPLDYEAIRAEMLADFRARHPDHAALLESDPAVKVIEVAAYRELLLRQRVNDAARANLIAFAGGADLDQLAAFYGVSRLAGETDADLRRRVIERIRGWSTLGGEAYYRACALSADPRVRDAAVQRADDGSPDRGTVIVSVLSAEGDGTATADLLDVVRAVVTARDVRAVNDTVLVRSAVIVTVDVTADVWLLPDTPAEIFDGLEGMLRAAHAEAGGLGKDLVLSWIDARLHAAGVYKVDRHAPAADAVADQATAIVIGAVSLRMAGRAC